MTRVEQTAVAIGGIQQEVRPCMTACTCLAIVPVRVKAF
jgi:hypothetical protein